MKTQYMFLQTSCLFLFLLLCGACQANSSEKDKADSTTDTAPLPFAVVELFTSEG